ncbi:glycerophosphodiester phosphodiesterase family protein [Actinomyces urinae]|uniref:glycerophosphodiester phosphodiesterase family protein n=1 Tax=Actinomyces urinae TaxID=1689268 RepID=UPI000931D26E|nr:glycerophosphodiester phosphodiesterase family protein [Actinomyces urinae]
MYDVPRRGAPLVVAHRGGANLAPENSWEAFENCARLGFQFVETDAHLTADGHVVLIHDPILDRVSDGFGLVSAHTLEELQDMTINGSARGPVLLADILQTFPHLKLNIDAKEEDVWRPMLEVIRAHGAMDRVCLASFDSGRLQRIREVAPEIRTSLGQVEVARLFLAAQTQTPRLVARQDWSRLGVVAAQIPLKIGHIRLVSKRFVSFAHSFGIAVHVWTLNEPEEIVQALDAGVDAIISDDPVLVREIIRARKSM